MRQKFEQENDKFTYIPVRLCSKMDFEANNMIFKSKYQNRLCAETKDGKLPFELKNIFENENRTSFSIEIF